MLLEPGDTVLVEEPSYLAALQAFQLAGATVVPVPCDDDGLDPDAAALLAERHGARLLYTIPTFQNPTGRTLPLDRREALVALARGAGFWLLEDDPYGELRYSRRAAADRWPRSTDDACSRSRRCRRSPRPGCGSAGCARPRRCAGRSRSPSRPPTCTPPRSTRPPPPAGWRRSTSTRASARCARATARAATRCSPGSRDALPPGSTHNRPDGGMFVWARLPDGWDAAALLDRALRARRRVRARLPVLRRPARHATLRLSFTTHPPAEIAEGLAPAARRLGRLAERAPCSARRGGRDRLGAADHELGRLRLLVHVADAGQPGQLARAGPRVQALRVAPLALGERRSRPRPRGTARPPPAWIARAASRSAR